MTSTLIYKRLRMRWSQRYMSSILRGRQLLPSEDQLQHIMFVPFFQRFLNMMFEQSGSLCISYSGCRHRLALHVRRPLLANVVQFHTIFGSRHCWAVPNGRNYRGGSTRSAWWMVLPAIRSRCRTSSERDNEKGHKERSIAQRSGRGSIIDKPRRTKVNGVDSAPPEILAAEM